MPRAAGDSGIAVQPPGQTRLAPQYRVTRIRSRVVAVFEPDGRAAGQVRTQLMIHLYAARIEQRTGLARTGRAFDFGCGVKVDPRAADRRPRQPASSDKA